MPVVRDNVLRVGDTPAHGGLVYISVDAGGQIARSASGQIIDPATVEPNRSTGEWSIDLPPLDEPGAVPEGAVYRVEVGRTAYHFRLSVADGEGPHDVANLLTDPPGALDPSGLAVHQGATDPHPGYATDADLAAHAAIPHGGEGGGAHPDAAEHEALGLETDADAQAKADAALAAAQAYADAAVAGLVGAAPEELDALYELAAALANDPNFAATVNAAIAARLTEGQADVLYRRIDALLGTADLDFDPATQAELNNHAHQVVERTVGFFHSPMGTVSGSRTTSAGWSWACPVVLVAGTYDALQCEVATAAAGTTTLYLYTSRADGKGPASRLASGTVDTSTTGYKVATIPAQAIAQGVYWLVLSADVGAVQFRRLDEWDRGNSTARGRSLFALTPPADPAQLFNDAAGTCWLAIRRSA